MPARYAEAYNATIPDKKRRTFAGMLSAVDEGIGNVTAALDAKGMLDDTLIVFTTDNGGPTTTGDGVGARNWPLRGGQPAASRRGPHGPNIPSVPNARHPQPSPPSTVCSSSWCPQRALLE